MSSTILLQVKDLTKTYNDEVTALNGIDLTIREGEFLAVTGPSGSGKTTLLNLIGALDRPTSGEIIFAGHSLSTLRDLDDFRSRTVGFVFQMHNLIPTLSAGENVEVPMLARRLPGRERRARVAKLLDLVDLADRATHLPAQLSGGQRQRVAIARALANNPRLLLADEPTGNLDTTSGQEVMGVLQRLNAQGGVTILVVTHSPRVARVAKRVLVLQDGVITRDESVGPAYLQDLREFRASALGQKLLHGEIPKELRGLGMEKILPGLRSILRNINPESAGVWIL